MIEIKAGYYLVEAPNSRFPVARKIIDVLPNSFLVSQIKRQDEPAEWWTLSEAERHGCIISKVIPSDTDNST